MIGRKILMSVLGFVIGFMCLGFLSSPTGGRMAAALESTRMGINGYEGELKELAVEDAIPAIRNLQIGLPSFLKEQEDLGGYGIESSIGGVLKKADASVHVFKLEFQSDETAKAALDMTMGESMQKAGPLTVENPMNTRNPDFGLFFDGAFWSGFRRDGNIVALMKGAVSQEDFFRVMEKVFEPKAAGATTSFDSIKIGLLTTLSGPGPIVRQGLDMKDGALLALEHARQSEEMKGRELELIIADDKGNPEEAVQQARRLIQKEGVMAIVGPFNSSCALAVMPVVTEAEIPLMTMATHPALTKPLQRYVFRGNMSDDHLGKLMADYATIMTGARRIAILYEDSPYGTAGMKVVQQRLRRVGREPVAVESYTSGNDQFSAQMERIKETNPDTIMVYGTIADAQNVMQWIHTSGVDAKVIASSGWASTELLPTVPKGLDGVVVAGYTHLIPDSLIYLGPGRIVLSPIASGHYQTVTAELAVDQFPAWPPFFRAFKETYERKPDLMAGYGYSNLMCLLEALKTVAFDTEELVKGLEATENFQTVFNHYINYHDEDHSGMTFINFSRYEDGEVKLATRDKSLAATKMRGEGIPVEAAGYQGRLYQLPPNTAAYFVLHMSYGYPPFMKQKREMGMYGGFRSDKHFHGMKYAYSGYLQNGEDKIMMVKMSFRSPDRVLAILNLEQTKKAVEDSIDVEMKPEEMRDADQGISWINGLWSAYKREGGTIVFAKGEVPLEEIQAAIRAAL